MSTASSASDRIEKARAALEGYDKARLQHDRFNEQYGFLAGSALPLAKALREMISPASVDETPEQVADDWSARLEERGLIETFGLDVVKKVAEAGGINEFCREAYLAGIQRGIVMGWNSWEPETAPGLPSGTVEQLVSEAEEALAAYRQTYDTYSEANGDEGDASMRDYEDYEDSIMDTHMPNVAAILTSLVAALKERS